MEPDLLILDEPAAGLNDTETRELSRFIRELHGDGLTVLLVEHDMTLVMGICQRVIVLASGRKIADASPEEIRRDAAVLEAYLGTEED
jgi:branched-chain amino acid transport system ATP-binding protein